MLLDSKKPSILWAFSVRMRDRQLLQLLSVFTVGDLVLRSSNQRKNRH